MIELYKEKYPDQVIADRQILERLILYELAEKKVMPAMIHVMTWEDVKKLIDNSIASYIEKNIRK